MKKKNLPVKLELKKKTITRLMAIEEQKAVAGGLTQYTTCCTSHPYEKQTACCSLASCGGKEVC